ncbi:hypothetical protein CRUP_011691 [Coryphaenoides rupestris]|nr:hypothetical protein CRUP_011691 [Coryphaenoides rupestris]
MQELVPFVQEVLGQKQRPRGLLKVYLVGAVLTLLGTAVGLVDAMCQPFTGWSTHNDAAVMEEERRRRTLPVRRRGLLRGAEAQVQQRDTSLETDAAPAGLAKTHGGHAHRATANRIHAS